MAVLFYLIGKTPFGTGIVRRTEVSTERERIMNFEKQTEFDKVKELWMNLAMTEAAREQIRQTPFILEEGKLRKQIRDTTNSRKLLEKLGTPPLQDVEE